MRPEELLAAIGHNEYVAAFRDNAIQESMLPSLSDQDLQEIGVADTNVRKRILWAIQSSGPLGSWLDSLGLRTCLSNFIANGIDLDTARTLSSKELAEIGIALVGQRRTILASLSTMLEHDPLLTLYSSSMQGSWEDRDSCGSVPYLTSTTLREYCATSESFWEDSRLGLSSSHSINGRLDGKSREELSTAVAQWGLDLALANEVVMLRGEGLIALEDYALLTNYRLLLRLDGFIHNIPLLSLDHYGPSGVVPCCIRYLSNGVERTIAPPKWIPRETIRLAQTAREFAILNADQVQILSATRHELRSRMSPFDFPRLLEFLHTTCVEVEPISGPALGHAPDSVGRKIALLVAIGVGTVLTIAVIGHDSTSPGSGKGGKVRGTNCWSVDNTAEYSVDPSRWMRAPPEAFRSCVHSHWTFLRCSRMGVGVSGGSVNMAGCERIVLAECCPKEFIDLGFGTGSCCWP